MDEKKYLVRTLQGSGWVDKTRSISSITPSGDYYIVAFKNSANDFRYGKTKVQFFDQPRNFELEGALVRIKGKSIAKWDAAISFGSYVRLFSESTTQLEKITDIELLTDLTERADTKKIVEYYFELARLSDEANPKMAYLSRYYKDKLGYIQPESVGHALVTGDVSKRELLCDVPLFPFGINPSQRQAVFNALESQISLIQGPPGTGKTQTILNIITNLVMQGKSVAVVAGNNSAVANVYEKLEKEGIGLIAASLGSSERQQAFFESEYKLPELSKWSLSRELLADLKAELKDISERITRLLEHNNQLAIVKEAYSRLQLERKYFDKHFDILPINMKGLSFFNRWKAPHILRFMADFMHQSQNENLSFQTKFKWLYKYRIFKFSDFQSLNNDIFKGVISEYYQTRSNELLDETTAIEQSLASDDFDRLLKRLTESSILIFKDFIADKYQAHRDIEFTQKNYKQNFDDFLKRFPVVLSTTDSIINNKNQAALFDYLIVDEASQVNLIAGFLTMSSTKNIIVVGDMQQLPHIPDSKINSSIDAKFSIPAGYSYFQESLLSSLICLFPAIPNTLLKEHYRCHPRIIDFCNQKYYNGQLIVMTIGKEDPFKIVKTVKGNHARKPKTGNGYFNVREIDVINNEILTEELKLTSSDNIGFISPYRAQADEAATRITTAGLVADTVHKFQGREKECIIFSTAANELKKYIDKPNLLNVAVSRAKNRFVMVTSPNVMKNQGSYIGDLLRHIEYHTLAPCIIESKTISIFDCLYKEYSTVLNAFRSKVNDKSKYPSENLMATLLDEILDLELYRSFYYYRDYPLHLFVNDFSRLDPEQRKFANHTYSHVDFLLFNKLDKQPVLAIEVDGYSFHAMNEKQSKRDKCKDSILEKQSLPLLRLATNESNERERVVAELNKLMSAAVS